MTLFARKIENCLFIDKVSGKSVAVYETRDGRQWLSTNRFLFGAIERGKP